METMLRQRPLISPGNILICRKCKFLKLHSFNAILYQLRCVLNLDFTGIVAEDPVQLTVSSSFFLGDAFVLFKSIKGVANGVNIVDNMFAGSDKGIDIVQLDQSNGPFNQVDQVVIDRNNVRGMKMKATVARGSVQGNSSSWTADFNSVLVFPNLIKQVGYTFVTNSNSFPVHALRSVSGNKVVIQSDVAVPASVYVTADQGGTSISS